MCVCVCVCPASCRRTHTSHHPKIWHWLLISPWLGTKPGGDPICWPPGGPPIVTPSEKRWRINNWTGARKQKLLTGVGLCTNFICGGLTLTLGPQSPPYQMLWELGGGQQTKVAPRGGFVYKNFICAELPPTIACRVLRSICTGQFHNEIVK